MQLRGENNEFKAGAAALRGTLAEEPAPLRAKIEPLLKRAADESQQMADQADSHDANRLAQTHAAFANSVKEVLAAFPADVQPGRPSAAREKAEEAIRANSGQGTPATTGVAR
jgi:cytochrome c556